MNFHFSSFKQNKLPPYKFHNIYRLVTTNSIKQTLKGTTYFQLILEFQLASISCRYSGRLQIVNLNASSSRPIKLYEILLRILYSTQGAFQQHKSFLDRAVYLCQRIWTDLKAGYDPLSRKILLRKLINMGHMEVLFVQYMTSYATDSHQPDS